MLTLTPQLIDFSPTRGVLIERPATDRDFIDGYVTRCESYDPATDLLAEYVSVGEAEHLDLIDDAMAADFRGQMEAARAAAEEVAA